MFPGCGRISADHGIQYGGQENRRGKCFVLRRSGSVKKGASLGSKIIIYTVLILCCLICIIPLITVVSVSFSDDMRLIKEGYGILPKGFSLEGYEYVFRAPAEIIRAYGVTILVTILGLVFGVSINALLAYVLSVKEYRFHKQLTIFLLIPMLLSGGIVSSYIWITSLNLKKIGRASCREGVYDRKR